MSPKTVGVLEALFRLKSRLTGVGRHPDPMRHFGPGGLAEAEALCVEANRDLPAFVLPPRDLSPADLQRARAADRALFRRERIRFPSPLPSGDPVNDMVHARLYLPRDGDSTGRVIVFHHPVYQKRWASWEWFLAPLLRRVPVAMMAGPYHFERTPRGQFAGEGTVNPNPWRLFQAIRQWAWDQRALRNALRDRLSLEPVAAIGFSLGAFQSILLAAAGDLDLPLVSIAATNRYAHGLLHGTIGVGIVDGMRRAGINPARLERMTESVQLDRYGSRLRGRPILYIVGEYDRVDPPPSLARLERALQPTRSLHLAAGHASLVLYRKRIAREIERFLKRNAIL